MCYVFISALSFILLDFIFGIFTFSIRNLSEKQTAVEFVSNSALKVYFQVEKNLKTESTFKFYNKSISAVGGETYFFLVSLENPKGPFLNYASI